MMDFCKNNAQYKPGEKFKTFCIWSSQPTRIKAGNAHIPGAYFVEKQHRFTFECAFHNDLFSRLEPHLHRHPELLLRRIACEGVEGKYGYSAQNPFNLKIATRMLYRVGIMQRCYYEFFNKNKSPIDLANLIFDSKLNDLKCFILTGKSKEQYGYAVHGFKHQLKDMAVNHSEEAALSFSVPYERLRNMNGFMFCPPCKFQIIVLDGAQFIINYEYPRFVDKTARLLAKCTRKHLVGPRLQRTYQIISGDNIQDIETTVPQALFELNV